MSRLVEVSVVKFFVGCNSPVVPQTGVFKFQPFHLVGKSEKDIYYLPYNEGLAVN